MLRLGAASLRYFALGAASLILRGALATEAACAAGAGPKSCGAAPGEVLLLQRHYSASLAPSSGALAEKAVKEQKSTRTLDHSLLAKQACHTAVEGDECYSHVNWAKTTGIFRSPHWYPGLTSSSTFEEFQALLHEQGRSACPAPCTASAPLPTPAAPTQLPRPPQGDVHVELTAFNVYYAALGRRTKGIGDAIAQLRPDIAVITEQWNEKPDILARARATSGRNYKFCDSGPQEKWWDGDILYDEDLWMNLKDGVKDWGANRGLSWALLQHRASGRRLLVYGAHPVCCGNERIHLQNALDFADHVQQTHPEWPEVPVVYMGDFNALEHWSSTKLYKTGYVHAYDRHWQLPMKFDDTFRAAPGNHWKDAATHDSGARLDYIFTERRDPPAFQTLSASIWKQAPGHSDHYPISAKVLLKR